MSDALPIAQVRTPHLIPLDERGREGAQLPVPLTSFIGREREIAAVCDLALRNDVRLLTLTGPAGVGKTRLAVRAAEQLVDQFEDGVGFVALAAITDPELVIPTVARELGVWETPQRTVGDSLLAFLREKQLLLVLDNFEQITAAAPELIDILAACPRVKLLVTSRALLRISPEQAFAVPPLAIPPLDKIPPPEVLARVDSIQLFVQRASAGRTGFAMSEENAPAIAAICHRLEGLPLAVELAAARVVHMPPRAILARLTPALPLLTGGPADVPARLRTMRDAIAWSYDLLSEREQEVFRTLSVFIGGFTLDAAEAVALSDRENGGAILAIVSSLVDKSLLTQGEDSDGEPRFAMFEAVREFGLEQLALSGEEAAVREAHAEYYLALAEHAAPLLRGANQRQWLDRLEHDLANLRAALVWLMRRNGDERGLRLAAALALLWYIRNHLHEGSELLARALASASEQPTLARAEALHAAGMMAFARGDYAVADALLQASLALARQLPDRRTEALALQWLGSLAEYTGDDDLAAERYEGALALFRQLDDAFWTALTLSNLADTFMRQVDLDRAAALSTEAVALSRQVGDGYVLWNNLGTRAGIEVSLLEWDRAAETYGEEVSVGLEIGDLRGVADALAGLGIVAIGRRLFERGVKLLAAADALREELGRGLLPGHALFNHAVATAKEAMTDAAFQTAWSAGAALSLEQAITESRQLIDPLPQPAKVDEKPPRPPVALTSREVEVLRLLVEGRTDREIAAALFISRRTAAGHVASILAKLAAVSRTDAAVRAVRQGLV